MADIEVPSEDQFTKQANIHFNIQTTLQDLITHFNTEHDNIVSKLDPKQATQFSTWWSNLSKCLQQHADLHEQLGQHLKNAGSSYHQLEGDIKKTFTPKP